MTRPCITHHDACPCREAARACLPYALARIATALGVTGSPDEIVEHVRRLKSDATHLERQRDEARDERAIHERSVVTWGHAIGRVCEALGVDSSGHADAIAARCVEAVDSLRAQLEAADALREAVARLPYGDGTTGIVDVLIAPVRAYDRARGGGT